MKSINYVAAMLAALLLGGCSKPVLDWRNAELSNGKIYESGSNEPFDGRVTGVPHKQLEPLLGSLRTILQNLNTNQTTSMTALLGNLDYVCDVEVDEGLVGGQYTCRYPQSQVVAYEGKRTDGGLDGETVFHTKTGSPGVILTMQNGRVEGPIKIYFAEKPGQLSYQATAVNNGLEGEAISYYLNGQVKVKANFKGSVPVGLWEAYWEENGAVSERGLYEGGKLVSQTHYLQDGTEYLTEPEMWALHRSISQSDDFTLTPKQEVLLTEAEKRYNAVRLLTPAQREAKYQAEQESIRADKIARGLDPDCWVCDGSDKRN